jgi:hypothetical protein
VIQHLFIVSRQQPDLYCYLAREFGEEPDVQVILDRRRSERRRRTDHASAMYADRRQTDRREKPDISPQLSTLGYAFVRLG